MKLFVVPEYTCKHPIYPHHNTVDIMYDAIAEHECEQVDWFHQERSDDWRQRD